MVTRGHKCFQAAYFNLHLSKIMALVRMSSISIEVSLVRSVGLYLSSSFSLYPELLFSLILSLVSPFWE